MPLTEQDEAVTHQQERTEWRRKQEIAVLKARVKKLEKIAVWLRYGIDTIAEIEDEYERYVDESDESKQRENNR